MAGDVTVNQPIHQQLRAIRRDQNQRQKHVATASGIDPSSLGYWERGEKTPFLHHADAWARTLNHQLVATSDGKIIDTLINLVPQLPGIRRHRGITQEALGHATLTSESAVNCFEGRIRAGDNLILATVEWYASGLGYQVGLTPARQLERAA